jgi:exonuclease SbcD
MKILHFADSHINDKAIEEIEKCLNFLVETAKAEAPDIIIHAGDVYDAAGTKADSLSAKLSFKIVKELADIAPVVIIIGTRSHDGKIAETLQYIKARFPVHVSTRPEQLYYADGRITDHAGILAPVEAILSLTPAPTKQHFATDSDIKGADSEIAQAMSAMFLGFAAQAEPYKDAAHVLVGHWQTDGALISTTQTLTGIDISLSKDQMALADADIILLGHLHLAQEIKPNIFYSGSITGLTFGELEDKGFYIHTFDGKKLTESRFIKTPSRKLIKLSADLTEDCAFEELDITLYSESADNLKDAHLRIELKVYQDEAQRVDAEKIKNFFLSGGAKEVDVKLIRVPRENVRSQNILKLTTLREKLKLTTLREKLIEQASLKKEVVPETILAKADLLEAETAEKIITSVATR